MHQARDPLRGPAIVYLLLQGLGGLAWWIMLLGWPATRAGFHPAAAPDTALLSFAAADLLLYVGGSLVAAFALAIRAPWSWAALWLHAGAASYAALYCLLQAWLAPETWRAAVLMSPSLLIPLAIAWRYRPGRDPR